jgi:hypothetical protein
MKPQRLAPIVVSLACWIVLILQGAASPGTSGFWTPAGTMLTARADAAAVLLDDGGVLLIGGDGSSGATTDVEIYRDGAGFSPLAPMQVARGRHAAVRLADGRVLVTGGLTADGPTSSAEIYDPVLNTWSPAGEMLEARAGHTASRLNDGRVIVAGGGSATLEIFDPANGTFAIAGAMSSVRQRHAAAVLADGRVLLAGGHNAAAAPLTSLDIYDPASGQIESGTMTGPRVAPSATTLLDGTVAIAGGHDGTRDVGSIEILDPVAHTLTAAGQLATPRSGHLAFLLPRNHSVLIVGGTSATSEGAVAPNAELFLPWSGAVRPTAPSVEARAASAGAALAERGGLLIAGGARDDAPLASAERFTFATIETDKDDYAPGETVWIIGQGWEPEETITLVLHEAQQTDASEDRVITANADSAGNIFSAVFAPDAGDLGVRFYLLARGRSSEAYTTFTDGELVTSELTGAVNDVTVTRGSQASFTINVSGEGPIRCTVTAATPATARVHTSFAISAAGVVTSSTDSAPMAFFGGAQQGSGQNCDITWNGAPAAYQVAATVTAAATTPVGTYTIPLSATAGTTSVITPGSGGGSPLTDAIPTNITVRVVAAADSTPPVITPTVSGTLGSNGWYTGDVQVTWSVTDAQSTITSSAGCGPTTISSDTTGMTLTCSATSAGGTSQQSVTVKRDATPPAAALEVTAGTAGTNGWYTSDVTVHTSGSDSISGPVTCTADQQQTAETTGTTFNGSCTNDAGLVSNATPLTIKLDKTGPTATLAVSAGTAGANGWYTSDVTVHTSGDDSISGLATCTSDQQQTMETSGTTFNGSCTNGAGLVTNATPLSVKVDKTAPTSVVQTPAGTLGLNGWYRSDVTVTTTGVESLSSPVVCTAPRVQSADTPGATFNGSCTNQAGLEASAAALSIKVDKTGPVIALVSPADAAGYILNSVVAASYGCTDATSGVATCAGPVVSGAALSTSPVGHYAFAVTATDQAGNSANVTHGYDVRFSTSLCLGSAGHTVLQPINVDGTSVFKQKSTIPVKFRVCDVNGISVGASVVANFRLAQMTYGTVTTDVNEPVDSTTPDVTFRWDPQDQQWIFNTNTKALSANRTYGYVVTLTDGSEIAYQFGLK